MFKVLWKDEKKCIYLAGRNGIWSLLDSLPPIGWEFNHMVPFVGGILYRVLEINKLEEDA